MSALSRAAHRWLGGGQMVDGASVSIVDGGIACARRTGVAHHLEDAAEITVESQTTLAARWLCGGSSVDALMLSADEVIDCVGCRLAAAVSQRPCVYYAWGESGELLYVGSSINVAQRIRGHMAQTGWWSEVRSLTFDEYDTEFEIRRAEFEAIAERAGKYNREGVRRRSPVDLGFAIGGDVAVTTSPSG